MERMNRQELTEEAMHIIEKKKERESESEREDNDERHGRKSMDGRRSLDIFRKHPKSHEGGVDSPLKHEQNAYP